jgi:hypothetical protein
MAEMCGDISGGWGESVRCTTRRVYRTGTMPLIVAGSLIAAAGLYWFSNIPLNGVYVHDILPGLMLVSIGLGCATTSGSTGGAGPVVI